MAQVLAEPEEALALDPVVAAKMAGLRYVNDGGPGIRRRRAGRGFMYIGVDGRPVKDAAVLRRIKSLVIPPAWTEVWISPLANGHIQATGRDERGRKQYKYHPRWREVRDETKFHLMTLFGEKLPLIRERVQADLIGRGLTRERVLASVVQLLDQTALRIGNEEYARQNGHFGLTTMRHEHVDVSGSTIQFHFVGKSGKEHELDVRDRRIARLVKQLEDLPGQNLFQYRDSDGTLRAIESSDVNDYLHEISGEEFSAKHFRTFHGSVVAARALHDGGQYESAADAKRRIKAAIDEAARFLGNTPTVCRKSYIHPGVIEAYMDGSLHSVWEERLPERAGLDRDEVALLALLARPLDQPARAG